MQRGIAIAARRLAAALLLACSNAALAAADAQAAPDPLAGLMLRTSLGLVAVLVLIFALAWIARRWGGALRAHGAIPMRVVSQLGLGSRERIVVVDVDGTWLVVGVTAHGMRTLHTMPARPDIAPGHAGAAAPPFSDRLQQALHRPPP